MAGWFGSDLVVDRLRALGVEHLALNPGASLRGLHDSMVNPPGHTPGMVLALHEEIAVAIGHGYASVTGRPMAAAVHDTVGLLHASMAIFNAWVDRVPILILVGTGPLDSARRRPWTDWIHTVGEQGALVKDFTVWNEQPTSVAAMLSSLPRALAASMTGAGGPVVLGFDVDVQETDADPALLDAMPAILRPSPRIAPDPVLVEQVVRDLRAASRPLLIVDRPLRQPASDALVRLAELTGAGLVDLGGGASFPVGHPHDVTEARKAATAAADQLLFVEVRDPSSALGKVDLGSRRIDSGWAGGPVASIGLARLMSHSWMVTESSGPDRVDLIADPELALTALVDAWGAARRPLDPALAGLAATPPPALPESPLDARGLHRGWVARAVGEAVAGEDWILANGVFGDWARRGLRWQRADQFLGKSGGSGLGHGPAASVGAALAVKGSGRIVLNLQGDGDFMYTPQSLWTAAHHEIPLLTIIDANRSYFQDERHQREVAKHRGRPVDNVGMGIEIGQPDIDHAQLGRGLGIAAEGPIRTMEVLRPALSRAVARVKGGEPVLLDVRTSPT
jgi:thiamine pyrophosphate-dependent acetolactate synthase large subunit-like protein